MLQNCRASLHRISHQEQLLVKVRNTSPKRSYENENEETAGFTYLSRSCCKKAIRAIEGLFVWTGQGIEGNILPAAITFVPIGLETSSTFQARAIVRRFLFEMIGTGC
jgi:hypothetical protein